MIRYCLALDLKDDPGLIEEYEAHHRHVWPEILHNIRQSGILHMEIYRIMNRLFMIMDTDLEFSFERKAQLENGNASNEKWETLMWKYQQALPCAAPGEKWKLMNRIFMFDANSSDEKTTV